MVDSGAMSVRDNYDVHYIGTDPNPDNFFDDGTSRYSNVQIFITRRHTEGTILLPNAYTRNLPTRPEEIVQRSEFLKYKGEINIVFTSPPYFNRAYSEDENQSYKKYASSYESWRDGFLKPTLQTCCIYNAVISSMEHSRHHQG